MPVIHVKNFQSIKDSSLEVKGFTALTGPNNSGKSALMRAIRGVFQNSPGTSFVRQGEVESEVTVTFDDAKVLWRKGTSSRSKPTYIVNEGAPINPGREVPEEVQALGVLPISAGGTEVWPTLAPQFTGQVFMLDRPGSHLAEAVADIERVSQLNAALKKSDSAKRSTTAELKVRRKDLGKAEAALDTFNGLDLVLLDIERLAEAHRLAGRVVRTHEKLSGMRDRLTDFRNEVTRLAPLDKVSVPTAQVAQGLLKDLMLVRLLRARLMAAQEALGALGGVEHISVPSTDVGAQLQTLTQAESLNTRLIQAREVEARLAPLGNPPDLNKNITTAQKLRQAIQKVEGLQERLRVVWREESELKSKTAELIRLEVVERREVNRLLVELGVCPTCGKDHQ